MKRWKNLGVDIGTSSRVAKAWRLVLRELDAVSAQVSASGESMYNNVYVYILYMSFIRYNFHIFTMLHIYIYTYICTLLIEYLCECVVLQTLQLGQGPCSPARKSAVHLWVVSSEVGNVWECYGMKHRAPTLSKVMQQFGGPKRHLVLSLITCEICLQRTSCAAEFFARPV